MMTGLPPSLSIALWIIGSVWLIALVALILDYPSEYVWATLAFGLVAGVGEWVIRRRSKL